MTKYGFGKTGDMLFDDAIARVTQALQGVGFGVLADIDVAGAMKKKLNQDITLLTLSSSTIFVQIQVIQ